MVESASNSQLEGAEAPIERLFTGCANCGTGKAAEGLTRCGNGLEKIYPATAVRFGYMRYIGEFTHEPELRFTCSAKVVIQTQRGIELGEQVSLTCTGCDKSVTRDQIKQWVKSSGEDTYMFDAGNILREATAADLAEFAHIQATCRPKRDFARQVAERHKLPLRVVECECPLGGERIIFYFTAAERVDFRAMVKELAKEYRTRIEMRQIGARDEARLLADHETCGREVCCKVFLKTLKPISMRMAKLQKATLDPSQVSGRCGRLKCCLRYEHVGYEELDKRLPRVGKQICTEHGEGVVVNRQILTQLVQVKMANDTLVTVVAEDILAAGEQERRPQTQPDERSPEASAAPRPKNGPAVSPKRPARRRRGSRPTEHRPRDSEAAPKAASSPESPGGGQQPSEPATRRNRRRRRRRRRRNGNGPGDGTGSAPPPKDP